LQERRREAVMICARCGNRELDDAVYCSSCGASLAPQARTESQMAWQSSDVRVATAPPPDATRLTEHQGPYQQDYERARAAASSRPQQQELADAKGFVASLFDFGFNSFVTPKVVKVIYVLIMIFIGLGAIGFALSALRVNAAFGIISLFILCPLFFFVNLALWRIVLELCMVVFRIADDIRQIRMRGDLRADNTEATGISS
jgi:ribosomal protein L37E